MTQNILKKAAVAGSAAALLTLVGSSQVSAAHLSISDNGRGSENEINFESNNSTRVSQSNDTNVSNDIKISGNTGGNNVSENTNGDITLRTGDVNSQVDISNTAGWNSTQLSGDCSVCDSENMSTRITGNGSGSENKIDIDLERDLTVNQENDSDIDNSVDVSGNTGGNSTSGGSGDYDNWWKEYYEKYNKDHNYEKDHGKMNKDHDYSDDNDKNHKSGYDYMHANNDENNNSWKDEDHRKMNMNSKHEKYSKNYDYGRTSYEKDHGYVKYAKNDNEDDKYDHKMKKNNNDWSKNQNSNNRKNDSYSNSRSFLDWLKKNHQKNYNHGGNTGGDVSMTTGDVNSHVKIGNLTGYNMFES